MNITFTYDNGTEETTIMETSHATKVRLFAHCLIQLSEKAERSNQLYDLIQPLKAEYDKLHNELNDLSSQIRDLY